MESGRRIFILRELLTAGHGRWDVEKAGLPSQEIEPRTFGNGQYYGRFMLTPKLSSRPSLQARLVAVTGADQAGRALVAIEPDPPQDPADPPGTRPLRAHRRRLCPREPCIDINRAARGPCRLLTLPVSAGWQGRDCRDGGSATNDVPTVMARLRVSCPTFRGPTPTRLPGTPLK